jgi:hypothetical protein
VTTAAAVLLAFSAIATAVVLACAMSNRDGDQ